MYMINDLRMHEESRETSYPRTYESMWVLVYYMHNISSISVHERFHERHHIHTHMTHYEYISVFDLYHTLLIWTRMKDRTRHHIHAHMNHSEYFSA